MICARPVKAGRNLHCLLVGAWLEAMRPVYEEMRSDSDVIDVDEMSRRSVVHSLNNLLTFPFVVAAVAAGELSLHGAWHDFGTGTLLAYNPDTDSFEKNRHQQFCESLLEKEGA